MKIAILSRDQTLYSTNRLKEAGEARGHEVKVIDYLRCYMNIPARRPQTLLQGKRLEGTQGVGVVMGEAIKAAEAVIVAFRRLGANSLVQEYIKESGRSEIRAIFVGNRVGAATRRTGAPGDCRSSLHRGGTAEKI